MIEVEGLIKRFGRSEGVPALQDMSFRVERGEIFGVLGADGAGKTTLFRVLTGLLVPTGGRATVASLDVALHRNRLGEIIGYMPQAPALPRAMTVAGYLDFWARVSGISPRPRRETIDRWLTLLDLTDQASEKVLNCTTFAQRRMFLALALLTDPDVLLLDEPMSGLSPPEWKNLVGKLKALNENGKTVLLSSPKLATLQRICSRIVTLAEGRATPVYETSALMRALGESRHARVFIDVEGPRSKAISALREVPGIIEVKETEAALTAFIDPGRFEAEKLRQLLGEAGIGIRFIRETEIVLGDVVRTLSRRESS